VLCRIESPTLGLKPPDGLILAAVAEHLTLTVCREEKDEVSRSMVEAGYTHERDVSPYATWQDVQHVSDDFFSIDFADLEQRVAIIFNRPDNFLHDGSPNGATIAKRRLLNGRGDQLRKLGHDDPRSADAARKGVARLPARLQAGIEILYDEGHVGLT